MANTDNDQREREVRIQRRFYRGETPSGEPLKRLEADESIRWVRWHFPAEKHDLDLDMETLSPGVLRAAAAFGLSTAAGNAAGQTKSLAEAIDAVENRVKTFLEGDWSSDRQAGPAMSTLIDAWVATRADQGVTIDPEKAREALRSGKMDAKTLLADVHIGAYIDAEKARKVIERAEKSKQAAASADVNSAIDAVLG